MVITKHFLADKMGLDFDIAQFFADRKIPAGNLYWKNKYLYVTFGTGYLFVPLVYDLLYKFGIQKDLLLREDRVEMMEQAFHVVASFEKKIIGFEEYIEQIKKIFLEKSVNDHLFSDLLRYFRNEPTQHFALGTSVPALNRADAFLFTITDIPIQESDLRVLLTKWYYMAATLLLLDDIVDLEIDRSENEENAIIELGDNKSAVEKAIKIFETNSNGLREMNPKLCDFFQKIFDKAIQDPPIQKLLQQ